MKVTQMLNRTGKPVPNHFVIVDNNKQIFQSYDTHIAEVENNTITLDTKALLYSQTTNKYLYMFVNMNKQQIQKAIEKGVIKTRGLN